MSDTNRETFLPVPNYPDYEASDRGRVRRIGSQICMSPSPVARKRYLAVGLSKDGKAKTEYMHRVCWSAHLGEIPAGMVIHHISGCRYDNTLSNLACVSQSENMRLSQADGSAHALKGETVPEAQGIRGRFNPTQVRCLRRARDSGVRGAVGKLAAEYGCSVALAGAVARGTLYGWVLDTALETEIAREEAIAARNIRKAIAASKRARASRKANTHKRTPPATIVGAA